MLAKAVVERARADLHDVDGVRYDDAAMLAFLSDAQRSTVLMRPDANAVLRVVDLEAGATRQSLPEDGVRFLGVLRNIGENGAPGRAVAVTTLDALNSSSSLWHALPRQDVIYEYAPDETTPTVYWVSPPPTGGVKVEIKYAVDPPELTDLNGELSVFATFAEALREYVLYRAFSRNDNPMDYQSRATLHLQRFFAALGQDAQARLLSSPLNYIAGGDMAMLGRGGKK